MTERRRGAGAAVATLLGTALTLGLAGCGGDGKASDTQTSDTQASENTTSSMITNGRYCGALSTELATRVLGTSELRATGDQLADGHKSPNSVVQCFINVVGSDDALNLTINLESSQPGPTATVPAPGCVRARVPKAWGAAFSCWSTDTLTTQATPEQGVFIRASQITEPQNRKAAEAAAPEMLQDIHTAITAMH